SPCGRPIAQLARVAIGRPQGDLTRRGERVPGELARRIERRPAEERRRQGDERARAEPSQRAQRLLPVLLHARRTPRGRGGIGRTRISGGKLRALEGQEPPLVV